MIAAAPTAHATPKSVWIPALVFSSVCLTFLFTAFFVRPNLTGPQETILNFIMPLSAGFATYFLGGTALLQVSRTDQSHGLKLAFSATAGIAVFVLVYLHPLFAPAAEGTAKTGHLFTPEENEVYAIKDKVLLLRGTHETVPRFGEPARVEVNTNAPKYASAILAIPDQRLDFTTQIQKYEYGLYAFMMAASTEDSTTQRVAYADSAIEAYKHVKELISSGRTRALRDAYVKETIDWVRDDDVESRVDYLFAMVQCLKAKTSGSVELKRAAHETLNTIPTAFKEKYPPDNTPELTWCVGSGGAK